MISKLIRLALIALAILTLALALPKLYKTTFEQRESNPNMIFSEILNDFVTITYEYDTTQLREVRVGRDRQGTVYTEKGLMDIFPMKNYRQLIYENRFPDSIRGVPVSAKIIENSSQFPLFLRAGGGNKPLLWMFESHTNRVKLSLPEDLFRISDRGIEFIKTTTNHVKGIDREKSDRFNAALKAEGFVAPSKHIYGMVSVTKKEDDGYFIVDCNEKFFHLKMVDGEPVCHQIPLPEGLTVNGMNCMYGSYGDYGYVYDQNYNIYLLKSADYSFFKLPIDDYKEFAELFTMEENLFFCIYQFSEWGRTKYYVFDKQHNLIASQEIKFPRYEDTKVGQRENYVFPFKALFLRDNGKKLTFVPYDWNRSLYVCIALTFILLGIKLFHRCNFRSIFTYIDLGIVLCTGIYGFLAVLIFPNRK